MKHIGILGLGKISHRVARGIAYANNAQLYAVASRSRAHAQAFQQEHLCAKAYGSYEELLQDEQVDMIYICTPNYLHYEHILMALRQHKHVICEKPLVSNIAQLNACFAFAKQQQCFLMEAEKTIFTPLNQKLFERIQQGIIGKLQYIEASYGYFLDHEEVGKEFWGFRQEDGGSAYDVGVYPIVYANYFAKSRLCNIQSVTKVTEKGYDEFMQSLLTYDNGVIASVRSAWNLDLVNRGFLYGEDGYIVCENFWKNTKATLVKDGQTTVIEAVMQSDFTGEIEHAVACIEAGMIESPILSADASREIMKVLQECKHVATSNTNL